MSNADYLYLPRIKLVRVLNVFRDLLSLNEDSLRDTAIFDLRLSDVDGSISEVVIDFALSNSVVFVLVLNDVLLEVPNKSEDLTVVFQPWRRDIWNVVVDWFFFGSI